MFSVKKGRPIARVVGGSSDGQILKILTKEEMDAKKLLPEDGIHGAIQIYGNGQMVKLHDGSFQVLPNKKRVERAYIAGRSGCGKSYFSGKYVKEWLYMNPAGKIKLFSRKSEDPAFDKIGQLVRVKLDDELLDDPLEPKDLADTLVIFDDIDTLRDKDIRNEVNALRADILETGRSDNVPVISTNHLLYDKAKTNMLLNEASSLTCFPRSVSAPKLRYFLVNYGDVTPKQAIYLKNVPSRWLHIVTDYPRYIIHETGAYFCDSNFEQVKDPMGPEKNTDSDSD
jgi:hypothetical protein